MEIGSYLRQCRVGAGLTVAMVVATSKTTPSPVPRQTLYLWESQRSKIDPLAIRRLLTLYGCRPDQIAYALALRSGDSTAVDPDALDNEPTEVGT